MHPTIDEYILAHIEPEPPLLAAMYREAQVKLLHGSMISGHLQGRLLKMLVQMIRPNRVLEIGTFTGYSALCMAEGLGEEAQLHTIEIDDEMEDFIRKYLKQSYFSDKIKLHVGDAKVIVPNFDDAYFDMVFMDGNKRNYWKIYELILPKISPRGFIIADNTLWHGKVVETIAENDWQTKGIVAFNEKLANDQRVEKVILPVRDGLTIIQKK